MSFPFKLLTICVLISFDTLHSQVLETLNLHKRLQWAGGSGATIETGAVIGFEGAVPSSHFGNLPAIVHKEKLTKFGRITGVRIRPILTEPLRDKIALQTLSNLTSDWQYRARITDARGTPYLVLEIIPLR